MEKVYQPPEYRPKVLILISGKRKCGKDFFVERLQKRLETKNLKAAVMRIAEPIKYYWAQKHDLNFEKLLDTSEYKEQHRLRMVEWSMEVRANSYGYFNKEAINMAKAEGNPVWICADLRHTKDREWFFEHYSSVIKTLKVTADESIRAQRGWKFTAGVDDGHSECDQDQWTEWDLVVQNNGNLDEVDKCIDKVTEEWIVHALK